MPVGDGSGAGTGTSSGTSRRTCQRGRPAGRADRIARYLPDEMRPSRGPTGRAWATSVPPLDREPVLAAQFIEVVVRTSANQVGLETTTGRSTTLGSRGVSVVVKGPQGALADRSPWRASSPPTTRAGSVASLGYVLDEVGRPSRLVTNVDLKRGFVDRRSARRPAPGGLFSGSILVRFR